jgi:CRP/FNR family cyclic AMP-dependent transcriptional regulator
MAQPATRHIDPTEHPALSASLRTLARRGVVKTYRKGTQLIEEGDLGDTLYIILTGRLRAYARNEQDKELTYGIYGPGEYLGEMSLDGGPRSASVITLEPSTCAVVTRRTLEQHLQDEPAFAFELLAKVIRRARAATLSARQMALNDVYGRLRQLLTGDLSVAQADATRLIDPMPTHRAIAAQLGCTREMVSRLLKELERGGYVVAAGGRLRIGARLPPRW